MAEHPIRIARAYEAADPAGGARVLVDRLWPRGVARGTAPWDRWCRDVAPSDELRRWFGHDPDRFAEFTTRYRVELTDPVRAAALRSLAELHAAGPLVLVTATRETRHSQAAVLLTLLTDRT